MIDAGHRTLAGRHLLRAMQWRSLTANAVGGTVAYVYLTQVAPPLPKPPENELPLSSASPRPTSSSPRCDDVNVAGRVEAATRKTGDTVLVSGDTMALLASSAAAALEERPAMPLKGKTEAVSLFAPKLAARREASAER